jgi:hypothetical protein
MIAVAVTAALLGLLRFSPALFMLLISLVAHLCALGLLFVLALLGSVLCALACDWLARRLFPAFTKSQSPARKTVNETSAEAEKA